MPLYRPAARPLCSRRRSTWPAPPDAARHRLPLRLIGNPSPGRDAANENPHIYMICPVSAIRPSGKQKSRRFCNFFAITDPLPSPTKRKQAVMQPITCAFAPQSAIGKLATIRNRKKVAKKSRFLFLDSRSSFGMTIWPERTQRSIVSGFAAAPVGGNRILHFVWCSCCSDGDTGS